jgi:tetratricopeptide (TPR) repeat protein
MDSRTALPRGIAAISGCLSKWQYPLFEAIASFEQAAKYQPQFYPAWQQKARALSSLKQFSEALVAINRAIAINSKDAVLYWEKGWYLGELKRYEEAVAAYTQAIEIKPPFFCLLQPGCCLRQAGKLRKGDRGL